MAKGIIVVDMPETCRHIRGEKEKGCPFGGLVCQVNQRDVMGYLVKGSKPDWCPIKEIKEIPVRLEELEYSHSMRDYQMKGFSRGWNACIDEMLKDGG